MKKRKFKVLLSLILGAAVMFAGCSSGGDDDSVKLQEIPGTIGKVNSELLAASELAKEIDPNDEKVILFYNRADGNYSDWALWLWEDGGEGELAFSSTIGQFKSKDVLYDGNTYKIGYMVLDPSMFTTSAPLVKDAIENKNNINFIIRKSDSWTKDTDDVAVDLSSTMHFMILSGDKDLYPISSVMTPFISSASMETLSTLKVVLSVKYALTGEPSDNGFSLVATDGTTVAVKDVVNYAAKTNRSENFTNTLFVKIDSDLDVSKTWMIKHQSFEPSDGRQISTQNAIKISLKDYKYSGDDLGLTFDGEKAVFKVWAPLASKVNILFYDDVSKVGNFKAETVDAKACGSTTEESLKGEPSAENEMSLDKETGIWSYTLDSVGSKKYYKYQITNNGITYWTSDIYAKACSPDAIASQIVDINAGTEYGTKEQYKNPFGSNGSDAKDNSDAIIYEMHIRDWSRATVSDSTGKFNDFASDEVIAHLKDLGVTHVQILPMFEYAQVVNDDGYNWGYNPYHYNVPESRYTDYSSDKDGMATVEQARAMIKKLHENGIAVIMDVVYNHTAGTQGGSLYDSTVPYYYYRIKADGTYSNGSGCGNETDSEAPMFRKYMIDSLKHWMLDYHINGFRFDLMGIHSKEAMKDIYEALSKIDQNVLVYGEPWTGGECLVENGATQAVSAGSYGVGAFDDDFRDAIKGAEFGGFKTGQVQGEIKDAKGSVIGTFNDTGIADGLVGESGKNNRNGTGEPGLALHYVECHDNFTLYDKLVYSLKENLEDVQKADKDGKIATKWPASVSEEQLELIKKEDKLAAAFVILSQGTPFMNGGQDFLRTKKGNPDSYSADTKGGIEWTNEAGEYNIDDVNTIDLSMKATYSDVYNVYKGLISLRKANSDAFGKNTNASAGKAKTINADKNEVKINGVTKYTTGDFRIFFNATDNEVEIASGEMTGYTKVIDVTSGTPEESTTVPTSIPAKSFVILKK